MTSPDSPWTVWGVAELGCWMLHRKHRWPTGRDAEDCIDAHVACGITHIAWELGRSVLTYHSDIPGATCHGVGRHYDLHYASLGAQQRAEMDVCRERCQLRAGLSYGRERGCTMYGRLCMNRNYAPGGRHRSDFAQNHPEWNEIARDGWLDASRLCYAIPEFRAERVAILVEAATIGCEGLVLDFLRQPPMARYHPALVNGYGEQAGVDPRSITIAEKGRFLDWCRYRAGFVTELLRELKLALDPIRTLSDRRIAVQARIPNDGFEANLIAGLDVETWVSEGLINEIALSELHWMPGYDDWTDRPYIELGARHSLPVFGSSNCLPMQKGPWSGKVNPRGVNPLVLARRALRSMEDGAQGISLYQSDTGVFWPGMPEAIRALHAEGALRSYCTDAAVIAEHPVTPENEEFGIDNHSDTRESLNRQLALGPEAFPL